MKKIIIFYTLLFLSFSNIFSQIEINKTSSILSKDEKKFEYYISQIGQNEKYQYFKGFADYAYFDSYFDCIYYQKNIETNEVDATSFNQYKILNETVNNGFLKVYTYDITKMNNSKEFININLLEISELNTKPLSTTIYKFDIGNSNINSLKIASAVSLDKQKIGFLLSFFDKNYKLYKLEAVIFNQENEIVWNQNIVLKDPIQTNVNNLLSLTNNGKLYFVTSEYNRLISPFFIINHKIISIDEDGSSIHNIETSSKKVVSSNVKSLSTGEIIIVDNIEYKSGNNKELEVIKFNSETQEIMNKTISLPKKNYGSQFVYNSKINTNNYFYDLIDIHENANKTIVLIFQDLHISNSTGKYKISSRNIYLTLLSDNFSDNNTVIIPHSSVFKTNIYTKECIGMSKIYYYNINGDIYLVYNDHLDNYLKPNSKEWLTNEDLLGEKNGIVLTHVDDQLNVESFCSRGENNSKITLRQCLYNQKNKIYFINNKYELEYIKF